VKKHYTVMETLDVLRDGTVQERKDVLVTINMYLLKTLLNIIGNVLENETFEDRIIKRDILSRYTDTYTTLLDRKVSLKEKQKLLQKSGYIYLPIFLEIVGDDVDAFLPNKVNRTLKDCPVAGCRSKRLKRLSNHLNNVHKIKDRKHWIQRAISSDKNNNDDDDDDE